MVHLKLKRINDNAYQLDLPAEYSVHYTFNISYLIPFVGFVDDDEHQDLRTNPFQGGGDDESTLGPTTGPHAPQGPITRSMLRKI